MKDIIHSEISVERIADKGTNAMVQRKQWKNCYEYKRILEILNDYWLTEPDEDVVEVDMRFLHSNGESQAKSIIWRNPKTREGREERIRRAWAFHD